MMGEEGRPGKKIKVKGRVKRPDRPPENPVIDVSPGCVHIGVGVGISHFLNPKSPPVVSL